MFCHETFILDLFILDYWEQKTQIENQQLFDGIIDVTLFDRVEGLDYCDEYVIHILKKIKKQSPTLF